MVNVTPPRFVRAPGPAREEGLGPVLRQAFAGRYDRLPALIEQLLARLGLRR